MGFYKTLKRKKILFINLFLLLYILINLFAGDRGLISYFEKKSILGELEKKQTNLIQKNKIMENKNNLLSQNLNFDFIDILIRDKFKYGKEGEILIKLND